MALKLGMSSASIEAACTMVANTQAYVQDGFNQYLDSFMNSPDQIFSPIIAMKQQPGEGEGNGLNLKLPGPAVEGDSGPFAAGHIAPTSQELDPWFGRLFGGDGTLMAFYNDYRLSVHQKGQDPIYDLNLAKTGNRQDIDVFRTMAALRGPVIVSGWGFGADVLPVPRVGNTYDDGGWSSSSAGQKGANTQFPPNCMFDRSYWKTGPIDLRWDDERQVWGTGPEIVCGVSVSAVGAAINPCSPAYFAVSIMRRLEDSETGRISNRLGEMIVVANRDPSLEQEMKSNAIFVIAIKLNYEWLPLWVGCPEYDCWEAGCGDEIEPKVIPKCLSKPGQL
jgi:hypothetical protein